MIYPLGVEGFGLRPYSLSKKCNYNHYQKAEAFEGSGFGAFTCTSTLPQMNDAGRIVRVLDVVARLHEWHMRGCSEFRKLRNPKP